MSGPFRTDVDRALASLGSASIGYRRFQSKIEPPRMDAARIDAARMSSVWQDAPQQLQPEAEHPFPLLMAVFPNAHFDAHPDMEPVLSLLRPADASNVPVPNAASPEAVTAPVRIAARLPLAQAAASLADTVTADRAAIAFDPDAEFFDQAPVFPDLGPARQTMAQRPECVQPAAIIATPPVEFPEKSMSRSPDPISIFKAEPVPAEMPPAERRDIPLSDMFKILRDEKMPKEVTMSQLQDVFRRL